MAGSLSDLSSTVLYPSHRTSSTTTSTENLFSSMPFPRNGMSKYGPALRILDDQELEHRRVAPKLLVPPFISCRDDRTLAGDKIVVHAENAILCVSSTCPRGRARPKPSTHSSHHDL